MFLAIEILMSRSCFILSICMLSFNLWGVSSQERIQEIDSKIIELKEMKRGYEARALRAEDQASRLQFEDHFMLETRRFNQIAEMNRQKAAKVQQEIDRLEQEKAELKKR